MIESSGSTSLTQVGSNYYLYNSGADPQLKYDGTAVVAGQISGWAPIAAEQISGGYQVVWKANGADQYTLWTTDSSGNFVSYIPAMSGSSSVLKSAETTFQQDLNGDGVLNSAPLGSRTNRFEVQISRRLMMRGALLAMIHSYSSKSQHAHK